MAKIVVTGGSGFLGSSLVARLKETENIQVTEFDFWEHSLFDLDSLYRLVKDVEVIYHLAGINDSQDPEVFRVNVLGTANILEAVRMVAPKVHFVFASSFAVYQTPKMGEVVSEDFPVAPRNRYGFSKLMAEELIQFYHRVYGIKSTIFRFSNIYGPGMPPNRHSVISTLVDNISQGEAVRLSGDGHQTRDFIYITDVISALIAAKDLENSFTRLNICSGIGTSLLEVLQYLTEYLGKKVDPEFKPEVETGGYWQGTHELASRILGWQPQVNIMEGLGKMLKGQR